MKLLCKRNDKYNLNNIVKHPDNSFGAPYIYFDFQVALNSNGVLLLNFDYFSLICSSCEGYLLPDKRMIKKEINFDCFNDGEITIDFSDAEKGQLIYKYEISEKITYDDEKNRVCFGDVNYEDIIRFGIGQYASFLDEKLVGVIIDLQ